MSQKPRSGAGPIAIVAMAGRFPGAADVNQLWQNLRNGVESVARIDDEEWARTLKSHSAFLVESESGEVPSEARCGRDVRRELLWLHAAGGADPGPSAAAVPGMRVGGPRVRRVRQRAHVEEGRRLRRCRPEQYLMNLLQHSEVVAKVGWLDADLSNRCDSLATRVSLQAQLERADLHGAVVLLDVAGRHSPRLPEPVER